MVESLSLVSVGYWRGDGSDIWPDVKAFVDLSWDSAVRERVIAHLNQGLVRRAYLGMSPCRICNKPNGSAELTDGTFVWPEGLAHYLEVHGVRLPERFVTHIGVLRESLEGAGIDDAWWSDAAPDWSSSPNERQLRQAMSPQAGPYSVDDIIPLRRPEIEGETGDWTSRWKLTVTSVPDDEVLNAVSAALTAAEEATVTMTRLTPSEIRLDLRTGDHPLMEDCFELIDRIMARIDEAVGGIVLMNDSLRRGWRTFRLIDQRRALADPQADQSEDSSSSFGPP